MPQIDVLVWQCYVAVDRLLDAADKGNTIISVGSAVLAAVNDHLAPLNAAGGRDEGTPAAASRGHAWRRAVSEPKWTPGPWTFTNGGLPRVMPSSGNGKTICGVHRIGRFKGANDGEATANGHLLAAAPTLYAALTDAKITLEEMAKVLARDFPSLANNVVNQCAIRCGDTLAKARGETP